MLSDLEILVNNCRTDIAKQYIQEALSCYNVRAYKSAIITTWIAIVYDILEKIQELARLGDSKAKEIEKMFITIRDNFDKDNPNTVRKLLEFENQILQLAKDKLEIIDSLQFDELNRIKQDRNKCAHPSMHKNGEVFLPSAELARLHIKNAITILLSQEPIQGKAALTTLKQLLCTPYFPREEQKIKLELQNSVLKKASKALVNRFIDMVFFDIFEEQLYKSNNYRILRAMYELYPVQTGEKLPQLIIKYFDKVDSESFYLLAAFITFFPEVQIFEKLDSAKQNRIESFIRQAPPNQLALFICPNLDFGKLKQKIEDRIFGLSTTDIKEMLSAVSPIRRETLFYVVKEKILWEYQHINKWEENNFIFNNLLNNYFHLLSKQEMQKLFQFICDDEHIKDATSTISMIKQLYTHYVTTPQDKELFDKKLSESALEKHIITTEEWNNMVSF